MKRVTVVGAVTGLAVLGLQGIAFAGGGGGYCPADAPAAPEGTVLTTDNCFLPSNTTVRAGEAVTWELRGAQALHTVTFDTGLDSGNLTSPFAVRFNRPGTYRYYCLYHGSVGQGMAGKVVVEGGAVAGEPSFEIVEAATVATLPDEAVSSATDAQPAAGDGVVARLIEAPEPAAGPTQITVDLEFGLPLVVLLAFLPFVLGLGVAWAARRGAG